MNYKKITKNEYPEKLKRIKKMPENLYVIGNINLLYEDSFAIVGSRNPTKYGVDICKMFSKEFALRRIPIISGMAKGIDEVSHKTILEFDERTIAVLGCGIEYYLENGENKKLISEIVKRCGLVVSEYDFFVENSKENFPQRNRIIAGLSEGVLVVEAAFRSGSSITARYASKYGKMVFAVPGRVDQKMSVGTNNLIKKGAIITTNVKDILERYPQFVNKKRKTLYKETQKESKIILKKEWGEIITLLENEICTLDELQIKTKKDIKTLIKLLSEMEIEGLIKQEIGIGYKLV